MKSAAAACLGLVVRATLDANLYQMDPWLSCGLLLRIYDSSTLVVNSGDLCVRGPGTSTNCSILLFLRIREIISNGKITGFCMVNGNLPWMLPMEKPLAGAFSCTFTRRLGFHMLLKG